MPDKQSIGKEVTDRLARFQRLPMLVRVVYARPRIFVAIAIGIVSFFLLPTSPRLVTRFLSDRLGLNLFASAPSVPVGASRQLSQSS